MLNYYELDDLRDADWAALTREEPERPPDRRRPPALTPAVDEPNQYRACEVEVRASNELRKSVPR